MSGHSKWAQIKREKSATDEDGGGMSPRRGNIVVDKDVAPDEDGLMETLREAGAEDLRDSDGQWEIVTPPEALADVRRALEEAGVPFVSAELTMLPQNAVPVERGK